MFFVTLSTGSASMSCSDKLQGTVVSDGFILEGEHHFGDKKKQRRGRDKWLYHAFPADIALVYNQSPILILKSGNFLIKFRDLVGEEGLRLETECVSQTFDIQISCETFLSFISIGQRYDIG
jgi:hypothetical protein